MFCSDSYKQKGDAAGQYNFKPYYNKNKPEIKPNKSFDLCRLGTCLFDFYVIDEDELHDEEEMDFTKEDLDISDIIKTWCLDTKGRNIAYKKNGEERYNDFKLYNNKVLPSVQPTHATSDMYWADERLGERIYGAYAFKDLLNSSKKIALGTDFPVEKVNPFHTFYSSIERKDLSGYPENGFQKENSLNREETLKGMTIWGAYFNFEENEKGSLEIGKAADFIIINQDIMEIDAKLIPETKVIKTFVDGEMVYNLDN